MGQAMEHFGTKIADIQGGGGGFIPLPAHACDNEIKTLLLTKCLSSLDKNLFLMVAW